MTQWNFDSFEKAWEFINVWNFANPVHVVSFKNKRGRVTRSIWVDRKGKFIHLYYVGGVSYSINNAHDFEELCRRCKFNIDGGGVPIYETNDLQ